MDYGKFNSAEELLKGYNELEKSFTQKCQQLAALQKNASSNVEESKSEIRNAESADAINAVEAPDNQASGTNETSSPLNNETNGSVATEQAACAVPADVDATPAAGDSPSSQQTSPLPKVMASGGNVSLIPPSKPRTIREASLLAKQLFGDV